MLIKFSDAKQKEWKVNIRAKRLELRNRTNARVTHNSDDR